MNEYMLMSAPRGGVYDDVQREKALARRHIRGEDGIIGLPHLTIMRYSSHLDFEKSIVSRLTDSLASHSGFDVELCGFDTFADHCIYLAFKDESSVRDLANSLHSFRSFLKARTGRPVELVSKPHISIVRAMRSEAFRRLSPFYLGRDFSGRYTVSELSLLRRASKAEPYVEAARIKLGSGGSPKCEQLALF